MKQYLINGGIALAMIVMALVVFTPTQKVTNNTVDNVGSVVADKIDTNCFTQNGVTVCRARVPMIFATTTPCAINIGQFGSSTLLRATIQQDIGSTSLVTIAKSADQFTTTTPLMITSVTAATQPVVSVIATSTTDGNVTAGKYLFGPGVGFKWLVFGVAAGTVTTNGPGGVCSAEWQVFK